MSQAINKNGNDWQKRRLAGWCVHLFTASGAFFGVLALHAIYKQHSLTAFWLMSLTIAIDAIDGMFARKINVKAVVPEIDGELLDNIVDFLNYTIVPAFFLLVTSIVPEYCRVLCVMAIVFSSAYQFTQIDAKTADHFFKGFPSYWNIVLFYLFFWQMNSWINLCIVFVLAFLSFVPIKYIYPSRLEYLTSSPILRSAFLAASIAWGIATLGLIWTYPSTNLLLVSVSFGYIVLYVAISLYRTWVPLRSAESFSARSF